MDTKCFLIFCFNVFLHTSPCYGANVYIRPLRDSEDIYLTFYEVKNLTWCIDECNARSFCTGLQYIRRTRVCNFIYDADLSTSTVSTSLERNVATYLKDNRGHVCSHMNCTLNEICNEHNGQCEVRECSRLYDSDSDTYMGNSISIGSKIKHTCKQGFIFPDGRAKYSHICSTNGSWTTEQFCISATCDNIGKITSVSGAYDTYDPTSQQIVEVWCDFKEDHGYTYIPSYAINDVTDISRYYTRADHVMIRYITRIGDEYEATLTTLREYSGEANITIVLNNTYNNIQDNLTYPVIVSKFSSIQLIVPTLDPKRNISGYALNGDPFTFEMSEEQLLGFAVSTGTELDIQELYCYFQVFYSFDCSWYDSITPVANTTLPSGYYFDVYFFMGNSKLFFYKYSNFLRLKTVRGVTFGFRFDIT